MILHEGWIILSEKDRPIAFDFNSQPYECTFFRDIFFCPIQNGKPIAYFESKQNKHPYLLKSARLVSVKLEVTE